MSRFLPNGWSECCSRHFQLNCASLNATLALQRIVPGGLMRSTLSWIGAVTIWASIVLLAGASPSTLSAQTGQTGAVTATQLRAQIEAAVAARDATRAAESFQILVARFPSTLNQLPNQE
jgi:hypothetical protein